MKTLRFTAEEARALLPDLMRTSIEVETADEAVRFADSLFRNVDPGIAARVKQGVFTEEELGASEDFYRLRYAAWIYAHAFHRVHQAA